MELPYVHRDHDVLNAIGVFNTLFVFVYWCVCLCVYVINFYVIFSGLSRYLKIKGNVSCLLLQDLFGAGCTCSCCFSNVHLLSYFVMTIKTFIWTHTVFFRRTQTPLFQHNHIGKCDRLECCRSWVRAPAVSNHTI